MTMEEIATEMAGGIERGRGPNPDLEFPHLSKKTMAEYVRLHHPDGTHSDIAGPTNPKYLERFIMHYLRKLVDGKRWFFTKPVTPPKELPIQCFVTTANGRRCTKRLQNIPQLFMHVTTRHGEESQLYADVLNQMKAQSQMALDPELMKQIGLDSSVGEPSAATEEQADVQVFRCRVDGCERFFDSEQGRNLHEVKCKKEKK
ncbi:MAG TPA: hypothetical protein VNA25_19410 [Phycisphaerae bacterium]|nr:hypothetical protein [Phycisphaerae bacterium]